MNQKAAVASPTYWSFFVLPDLFALDPNGAMGFGIYTLPGIAREAQIQ
jgi:hypothetical protein